MRKLHTAMVTVCNVCNRVFAADTELREHQLRTGHNI